MSYLTIGGIGWGKGRKRGMTRVQKRGTYPILFQVVKDLSVNHLNLRLYDSHAEEISFKDSLPHIFSRCMHPIRLCLLFPFHKPFL
jgi:hypothetical protein